MREPRESLRALRRGWLVRHELDDALEGRTGGRGPPALMQVVAEAIVEARGAQRVALLGQLDRSLSELDGARRRTRLAGELGRPGAELGQVDLHELGRARNGVPQLERPLDVRERLGQAEHRLRLTGCFDRRNERLCRATRRRPVRREFRWRCGGAVCERLRQERVQLLALSGQDRRVDRLRQERVPKAEPPLARSATRTPCSTAPRSDSRTSLSGSSATVQSSG